MYPKLNFRLFFLTGLLAITLSILIGTPLLAQQGQTLFLPFFSSPFSDELQSDTKQPSGISEPEDETSTVQAGDETHSEGEVVTPLSTDVQEQFQWTEALGNRLGVPQSDENVHGLIVGTPIEPSAFTGQDSVYASAVDVTLEPIFDERTAQNLDLAGTSPNDGARKRLSLGDFNNDGAEDIVVARWNKNAQLFININGVLTLRNSAFANIGDTASAKHAGVVDANGDGWLDLVFKKRVLFNLGNDNNGNWRGFGAGQNNLAGAENNPFTILAADFDGDGDQDLSTYPGQKMLVNNGSGSFSNQSGRLSGNRFSEIIKAQTLDIDGDGDMDMHGPNEDENRHFIFLNNGNGSFPQSRQFELNLDTLTYVPVGGDFNGDNIADFRIYSDGDNPRAFISTGTFSGNIPNYNRRVDPQIAGDQGKHGLSHVRDVDNDGDLDFVLSSIELFQSNADKANEKSNIIVNRNVNSGQFTQFHDAEWGNEESWDIKITDINLDGNMDLFVAHNKRLAVYLNDAPPLVLEISGHNNSPAQVGSSANMDVQANGLQADALFTWDMGDGTTLTTGNTSSVAHAYGTPGRYLVTVLVTNENNADSYTFWQTVFATQTANRPNSASTIAYENLPGGNNSDRAWVVNSDQSTVSAVQIGNGNILAEIAVGANPTSLAFGGDGRLYVVNKDDATISIINPAALSVEDTFNGFARGSAPHGIVFNPSSNSRTAYVTLELTGELAKVDFGTGNVGIQSVGPLPRGLAVNADGSKVYVSRFITAPVPGENTRNLGTGGGGEVWVINGSNLVTENTIILPYNDQPDEASSARGIPNYLMAPIISPSGAFAFVPANSSNIYRGVFRDGNPREHNMLVRSMLAQLTLQNNAEDIAARHDFDNSSQPTAGAFDPTGNYLYLVFEGARKLRVYDIYAQESVASVDLGFAPRGVTVSPDGNRVIAHNYLSRSIHVLDAASFVAGLDPEHQILAEHTTVGSEVLSAEMLLGKRHFFDSADPRLTAQFYMSCAVCHADGGHDGRTWDFSDVGEGLRNTTDLRGRAGVGHGFVHWTANFDEIHDFENDMRDIFKGDGLMSDADFAANTATLGSPKAGLSADLDALALFVSSLTTVGQSPYRSDDGSMSASAIAGRQVFVNVGCAACHSGSAFTDSPAGGNFHNIGTVDADTGGRLGQPLINGGIDTPTLLGLWHGAPYLHDGSAPNVRDAVLAHTSSAVGFNVNALSNTDLNNLVDYLLQLEANPPILTNPGEQNTPEFTPVSLALAAMDPDADTLTFSASNLPNGLTIDANSGIIAGTTGAAGAFDVMITVDDGTGRTDGGSFRWIIGDPSPNILFVSSTSNGTVAGIAFEDEDILAFNTDDNSWSMFLDGSAIGLDGEGARDIDAFHVQSDGTILFSISGDISIPGLGNVDDSDIIQFVPTGFGAETAGTLSLYFDGSDVNLTTQNEDMDAIHLLSSGDIVISTRGNYGVASINGGDEDLLRFIPTSLGNTTAGTWATYFDGSAAGLNDNADEDIFGAYINEILNETHLTTRGNFAVAGVNGTGADVLLCSGPLGNSGACSFSLAWDGSAFGFGDERVDSLSWTFQMPSLNNAPTMTSPGDQTGTVGETTTLSIIASDADNDDSLVFSAAGLPTGLGLNNSTGEISGVPNTIGLFAVTISVDDGNGGTASTNFTWTVNPPPNSDPVLTPPGDQTSTVDVPISLAITATDADEGDTLTFSATGLPAGLSMDVNGIIAGTKTAAGSYTVVVTVNDGNGGSDSISFNWFVNGVVNIAPSANAGTDQTVTDSDNDGGETITLNGSGSSDSDGTINTYTWNGIDGITIPSVASPTVNVPVGSYNVTLTVTDDDGATASDTVAITVNAAANNPPILTIPDNQSNVVGEPINLTVTATDADGNTLNFSATGLPDGLTMSSSGDIVGTVTTTGSFSVTVTVDDGNGGSDSAAFSWTVNDVVASCGGLSQEAESAELAGNFIIGNDAAASNGSYIHVPDGVGNAGFGSTSRAVFCFNVIQAGTYRLLGTVYAADGGSDSFFVTINGQPSGGYLWDVLRNTQYAADYLNNRSVADPVEVPLPVGEQTIIVYLREDGTRLDKLTLERVDGGSTNNPPTVTNPGNQTSVVGDSVSLSIVANDADGDTLSLSASGLPAGLTLNNATSQINGIPTTAGSFDVSLSVTDGQGGSDSVSFNWIVTDNLTACGGLDQEAEDGQLFGNMVSVNDGAASGSAYIHVPNGVGNAGFGSTSRAVFCFNVIQAGTYRLLGTVYAADGGSNSFFVSVDGQPSNGYLWDVNVNSQYTDDYVNNRNGADPVEVNLTAGEHTIVVYLREDGTRLDNLALEPVAQVAAAALRQATAERPLLSRGLLGAMTNLASLRSNVESESAARHFANIKITLVDAETRGDVFRDSQQTDPFGRFFFDEMMVGEFLLIADVEGTLIEEPVMLDDNGMVILSLGLDVDELDNELNNDVNGSGWNHSIFLPLFEQ
ncbi:MAG: putative Ig domain-containing protein [Chloroflexota bacterium]